MDSIVQLILLGLAASVIEGVSTMHYSPGTNPNETCCRYLFRKEWNHYSRCVAANGVPPFCAQKSYVCYHNSMVYNVGDVVANKPSKCHRLTCDLKPPKFGPQYPMGMHFQGFIGMIPAEQDFGKDTQVTAHQLGHSGCCMKDDVMFLNSFQMKTNPHTCLVETCRDGQWKIEEIPGCFRGKERPCYFEGRLYLSGEILVQSDCLELICSEGFWKKSDFDKCADCHSSSGDLFYPFSQRPFRIKGHCNYTMIQEGVSPSAPALVSAKFYECDPVTHDQCPMEIVIRQSRHMLVELKLGGLVTVNGDIKSLPYSHPSQPLLIWEQKGRIRVLAFDGILVSYDMKIDKPEMSILSPHHKFTRKLAGLCGMQDTPPGIDEDAISYVYGNERPLDFFWKWNLDLSNKCVLEGVCSNTKRQTYAKLCKHVIEAVSSLGCELLVSNNECVNNMCACCGGNATEECWRTCIPNVGEIRCKPQSPYEESSVKEVAMAASNFARAMKPYVERSSCLFQEYTDMMYNGMSGLMSTFVDVKPSLLEAMIEVSPVMAEFLEGVTPPLVKVAVNLSPIALKLLERFQPYIGVLLNKVESALKRNLCIWSPSCRNFLQIFRVAKDSINHILMPPLQPLKLKCERYGSAINQSLSTLPETSYTKVIDQFKHNGILATISHIRNIINSAFKTPRELASELKIQLKEGLKNVGRHIAEALETSELELCRNGCNFQSTRCQREAIAESKPSSDFTVDISSSETQDTEDEGLGTPIDAIGDAEFIAESAPETIAKTFPYFIQDKLTFLPFPWFFPSGEMGPIIHMKSLLNQNLAPLNPKSPLPLPLPREYGNSRTGRLLSFQSSTDIPESVEMDSVSITEEDVIPTENNADAQLHPETTQMISSTNHDSTDAQIINSTKNNSGSAPMLNSTQHDSEIQTNDEIDEESDTQDIIMKRFPSSTSEEMNVRSDQGPLTNKSNDETRFTEVDTMSITRNSIQEYPVFLVYDTREGTSSTPLPEDSDHSSMISDQSSTQAMPRYTITSEIPPAIEVDLQKHYEEKNPIDKGIFNNLTEAADKDITTIENNVTDTPDTKDEYIQIGTTDSVEIKKAKESLEVKIQQEFISQQSKNETLGEDKSKNVSNETENNDPSHNGIEFPVLHRNSKIFKDPGVLKNSRSNTENTVDSGEEMPSIKSIPTIPPEKSDKYNETSEIVGEEPQSQSNDETSQKTTINSEDGDNEALHSKLGEIFEDLGIDESSRILFEKRLMQMILMIKDKQMSTSTESSLTVPTQNPMTEFHEKHQDTNPNPHTNLK